MSKGSAQRPTDAAKYHDGWERTFGRCSHCGGPALKGGHCGNLQCPGKTTKEAEDGRA